MLYLTLYVRMLLTLTLFYTLRRDRVLPADYIDEDDDRFLLVLYFGDHRSVHC